VARALKMQCAAQADEPPADHRDAARPSARLRRRSAACGCELDWSGGGVEAKVQRAARANTASTQQRHPLFLLWRTDAGARREVLSPRLFPIQPRNSPFLQDSSWPSAMPPVTSEIALFADRREFRIPRVSVPPTSLSRLQKNNRESLRCWRGADEVRVGVAFCQDSPWPTALRAKSKEKKTGETGQFQKV